MTGQPGSNLSATITSTALLEALKNTQDEQAWQPFVNRYRPVIVRYSRRMGLSDSEAEDAAQQTLLHFHEAYVQGKYDRAKGHLRKWLFGIAHNQIVDVLRERRRREVQVANRTDQTDMFAQVPAEDAAEQAWEQEWRLTLLRQCLDQVRQECEPKTLRAFEMLTWEGWPAQKIAERLGMTVNAVFLAKFRILKRVRELLPQMEEIW
jgi:RNA polymerase sigma factor (sigma-70 family)